MNTEQKFFISLLADHLNGRKSTVPDGLNWEDVIALSRSHQLSGILYSQCKGSIPEENSRELGRAYSLTFYFYAARTAEIGRLTEGLAGAGIPYFLVKGSVLAAYYPVPALRTMGDTDIVVHAEDRIRANDILLGQGFNGGPMFEGMEWKYSKKEISVELHSDLVYDESVSREEHAGFFNECWPYVRGNELDCSFHFLFLILHLRKHLMNSGVGFRQFMDIALMSQKELRLDWEWIDGKLRALGMREFAGRVFALNERWFGIGTPLGGSVISEEFFASATDYVLSNGVFGRDNPENNKLRAINDRLANRETHALPGLFPSYSTLLCVPKYSYIKGRPYLLPFVWISRIIKSVFSRQKLQRLFRNIRRSHVDQDEVDSRSAFLKQWGL